MRLVFQLSTTATVPLGPEGSGGVAGRRARPPSRTSLVLRPRGTAQLRELGVSKTAIAKITGVSRTTLYSFMSTRGLRPTR